MDRGDPPAHRTHPNRLRARVEGPVTFWRLDRRPPDRPATDHRPVPAHGLHDQHADGRRTDLPRPSIDTGMGIERLAAVLQGVHDNYDIDLFRALIAASKALTGP